MSASDYEDAYHRLLKLRLNKERQREIAPVVIKCVGAEMQYNPYYTLVASKMCSDRKVRWSFQNALWRVFKQLGESIFGEEADDEEEEEEEEGGEGKMELRRIVNIAKMYGNLVVKAGLPLSGLLKCLNLPYLGSKTKGLVEILLITILLEAGYQNDGKAMEQVINKVFAPVEEVPELARGLQWFLRKVVRKTELVPPSKGNKNDKIVQSSRKEAEKVLARALASAQGLLD